MNTTQVRKHSSVIMVTINGGNNINNDNSDKKSDYITNNDNDSGNV